MKNQADNNEYLIIPNPIYDVVFRYLMQDPKSAKIVLSTLINEKIKSLDFRPLTYAKKKLENEKEVKNIKIRDPRTERDIKLFHLDFTAVIELSDGTEELVMIELQKVDGEGDIFRFKQYIAENFQKKRKIEIKDPDTDEPRTIDMPYRLIPIFILNFKIENEIKDLMIKTRQVKTGVFTDKIFEKHNQFIDNLSYRLYVVQLPYLHQIDKACYENDEYKSKLFALLKLFDQKSKKDDNEHRLRLVRRIFPGFLDRVIERLQAADMDNPDLEKQMKAEDQYLKILKERDNKISFFKLKYQKKSKELENTAKKLDNTAKKLDNTEKQLDNEKRSSQKKDEMIKDLAKTMKENDIPLKIIVEKTQLTEAEIKKL